jgi:hypothetical protein
MMRSSIVALVLVLAIGAPTRAHAGLPAELTSACGDEIKDATRARVIGGTQGETDYLVWMKRGVRLYSVTGGSADPCGLPAVCTAFDGKALARARGRFATTGGDATAVIVPVATCLTDACPRLIVVQRSATTVLGALRAPDGCEPRLAKLALDRTHDAVHLTCSTPAGAGDLQSHLAYRVAEGALATILSIDGGTTQLASPVERADGKCTIGPVGAIQIVTIDRAPAWRVTRAPDAGQTGASCKQQQAIEEDLRWDGKAGAFEPLGAPRPLARDTCACRR